MSAAILTRLYATAERSLAPTPTSNIFTKSGRQGGAGEVLSLMW